MKKILFLFLIIGLLIGCYHPSWYRPETTYEQLKKDSDDCKGKLILGSTREEKISAYEKCMSERGYTKKPKSTEKIEAPRRNIGPGTDTGWGGK